MPSRTSGSPRRGAPCERPIKHANEGSGVRGRCPRPQRARSMAEMTGRQNWRPEHRRRTVQLHHRIRPLACEQGRADRREDAMARRFGLVPRVGLHRVAVGVEGNGRKTAAAANDESENAIARRRQIGHEPDRDHRPQQQDKSDQPCECTKQTVSPGSGCEALANSMKKQDSCPYGNHRIGPLQCDPAHARQIASTLCRDRLQRVHCAQLRNALRHVGRQSSIPLSNASA